MGHHPASCHDPDCALSYAEHLRTVAISAHATPTRRPEPVCIDATEARWDRDGDAYKALRSQGYQPRGIDGCADLTATAKDRHDIEGTVRPSPLVEPL